MNEKHITVSAEPIGFFGGELRYTVEVNGMIDYLEIMSADEVRSLIAALQQALKDNGEEGGAS